MAIKANAITSADRLRASLSKKNQGARFLTRQKADQKKVVRFLDEPGDEGGWVDFREYFDEDLNRYVPVEDDTVLDAETKVYVRYLTNVVDIFENRVDPLVIPKTQMERLMKWYDRNKTLTDRDYELTREGMGFNTTYDAMPADDKFPRDVERFVGQKSNLIDLLNAQLEEIDTNRPTASSTAKDSDTIPFNNAGSSREDSSQTVQTTRNDDANEPEQIRSLRKTLVKR